MYLLGRHILARNFFLRPKYVPYVPELVRAHHARRFAEIYEATKRLGLTDEYHRTKGAASCAPRWSWTGARGASTTCSSA